MSTPGTRSLEPVVPGHVPTDTRCQDLPEGIARLIDGVTLLSSNHVDTHNAEVENAVNASDVAEVGAMESSVDQDKGGVEDLGDRAPETIDAMVEKDAVADGITETSPDKATVLMSTETTIASVGANVQYNSVVGPAEASDASDMAIVDGDVAAETTCDRPDRATKEYTVCEEATETYVALDRATIERFIVADGSDSATDAVTRTAKTSVANRCCRTRCWSWGYSDLCCI